MEERLQRITVRLFFASRPKGCDEDPFPQMIEGNKAVTLSVPESKNPHDEEFQTQIFVLFSDTFSNLFTQLTPFMSGVSVEPYSEVNVKNMTRVSELFATGGHFRITVNLNCDALQEKGLSHLLKNGPRGK